MADNLEKYFKKHLSEESPGEDNWNVPSDDVWEKALPEIRKKRGLFIPWKYIYLAGALLLVGLATLLWVTTNPDKPQEEQTALNSTIENGPAVTGIEGEKGKKINEALQQKDKNQDGKDPAVESSPVAGGIGDDKNLITTDKTIQPDKTASHQQILSERPDNYAKTGDRAVEKKRESDKLDLLASLNPGEIVYIPEKIVLDLEISDVSTPVFPREKENLQYNNKGRLGIGAFYAPTFNNTSVIGDINNGVLETGDVYLYSGNFGVDLRYYLTDRLSLHTGIERTEFKSWSRSEIDFAYDASTENKVPGGEMENTSPVPMPTPFGEINTEITYRFSSQDGLPNGEPMRSLLDTHQEITYFSVPLGLEYTILPFSPMNWFVEGGLRYNRAYRDATEFTSRILHLGDDMQVVDESTTNHPTYTVNFLNFYLGTGVNYQLNESFLLSGSARYFRNITRVNFQDDATTHVQGFGLKIGFSYLF